MPLNVVSSTALGLHLHDREFRLCLDYWLGLKITGKNPKCSVCAKEGIVDSFGDHYVGCGSNGDRIHRHNSLRDVLFSATQSAALAPRKEIPSLIPGTNSCPADIFLPNWCRGRPAALDHCHFHPTILYPACCRQHPRPCFMHRRGEEDDCS